MDTNNVVELLSSEDEDDVHLLEKDVQNNKNGTSSEETSKINSNPEDIIEIEDTNSSQESIKSGNSGSSHSLKTQRAYFVYNKQVINPLSINYTQEFEKFYRTCLKLDHRDGLKRVLERKLLPAYQNTEEEYLKTNRFLTFLNRLKINLKTHEYLKFSIVKELLDVLMNHQKKKKRVQPITISKVTGKSRKDSKHQPEELNSSGSSVNKTLENNYSGQSVINLDNDDELTGKEMHNMTVVEPFIINHMSAIHQKVPIMNIEAPNNNLEVPIMNIEVPIVKMEMPHNNLEVPNYFEVPISDSQYGQEIIVEVPSIREQVPSHVEEVPNSKEIENDYGEENNLLAATNHILVSSESENEFQQNPPESKQESQPNCIELEIKYWETMLETCHKKIKYYDEQEVDFDGLCSPYVMVENWKARSVNIYKKLCQLTGSSQSVWKPKQIRLKVKEGHPPGPARMLEQWLNLNMDRSHYVLPDLSDVIQCVEQAVRDDGLDWSQTDVIKEARSLFVHCGTTIQKYRQQREWKDLVMTTEEALDPADEDPYLKAKLEMNRQIAKRKENDLLEHYTNLELGTKRRRKSNETTQNTSTTKHKLKENNNCNITDKEAKKSKLQERNTKNSVKNTTERNIAETITFGMSETQVDSTTPELDENLIRLNNPDYERPDSQTDDHDETFIINYDNDECKTNAFDISNDHVDSTTPVSKENNSHDVTTDLGINNKEGDEIINDNTQVSEGNEVLYSIEENIVIKQEESVKMKVKLVTSDVVDGTADFVKQYGHITESDIIHLRTIIFNNEPTVTVDILDSDSENDGVTT